MLLRFTVGLEVNWFRFSQTTGARIKNGRVGGDEVARPRRVASPIAVANVEHSSVSMLQEDVAVFRISVHDFVFHFLGTVDERDFYCMPVAAAIRENTSVQLRGYAE